MNRLHCILSVQPFFAANRADGPKGAFPIYDRGTGHFLKISGVEFFVTARHCLFFPNGDLRAPIEDHFCFRYDLPGSKLGVTFSQLCAPSEAPHPNGIPPNLDFAALLVDTQTGMTDLSFDLGSGKFPTNMSALKIGSHLLVTGFRNPEGSVIDYENKSVSPVLHSILGIYEGQGDYGLESIRISEQLTSQMDDWSGENPNGMSGGAVWHRFNPDSWHYCGLLVAMGSQHARFVSGFTIFGLLRKMAVELRCE